MTWRKRHSLGGREVSLVVEVIVSGTTDEKKENCHSVYTVHLMLNACMLLKTCTCKPKLAGVDSSVE